MLLTSSQHPLIVCVRARVCVLNYHYLYIYTVCLCTNTFM